MPRTTGRASLGCSASGGIVINPQKRTLPELGCLLQEPVGLIGGNAGLGLSPATFTCSRQSTGCAARDSIWAHTDSESMAWIRRTRPTTSRTLRLCRWPMKSQVKLSANSSCLAARCVASVLAHERHAARAQRLHAVDVDVLGGGQDLDRGPDL